MKFIKQFLSGMTGLLLVSCVTINIYFPEAAAEKAADIIIEDVWGEGGNRPVDEVIEEDTSSRSEISQPLTVTFLNWLIPPAEAVEANLNISSAGINSIQHRMKVRHGNLKTYYDNGAIGLTEDGFIEIRDIKAVPLKDRNNIKQLVSDENSDRTDLYAAIARANGHPEWQGEIQSTFARQWVSKASPGWWYRSSGVWKQK